MTRVWRRPIPKTEPIRYFNRRSGTIEEELVYRRGFMDFMYGTRLGLCLTEFVFKRPLFTRLYTLDRRSARSRPTIAAFIDRYDLDPSEFLRPVDAYGSFNDFFKRRLQPGARPIDADPTRLIAPGDGKLLALPIDQGRVFPVKGHSFALDELVGDRAIAASFQGGWCLILRLCPPDYHRFCFVDGGSHGAVTSLGGSHYSVSLLAQRLGLPIFTQNHRTFCLVDTHGFGTVLQMEVGSFSVGKIALHSWMGGTCARGEEKGWFEFGASTLVVLIAPGIVDIDGDILDHSRRHIETLVLMGEGIASRRVSEVPA